MKKRNSIISALLAIIFIFSMVSPAFANGDQPVEKPVNVGKHRGDITFDFADSHQAKWAEEYIGKMQSKDVIKGYVDGTFKPNAPVKRIEAIIMAVRLMGLEEEALAKSPSTKLHFKDADQIPAWGKGHVIVALENGLFDGTEDKILAHKPASRIWIVNLLVHALDLKKEALGLMTQVPDFKDSSQIPAGSVGYVNIAVKNGIITGYDDNTFKANKPVTRGEMAAFLDRTNDGLLENSGAVTIQGKITNVTFSGTKEEATEGQVSILTLDGTKATYTVAANLLVQFGKRFIQADQLLVDDFVTAVVKDGAIIEANLIDEKIAATASNIVELEIEVDLENNEKTMIKYKNKKGKTEAEIETKTKDKKVKVKGKEAIEQVESLIEQLALTSDHSKEEMIEGVVAALNIEKSDIEELEVEVKFSNGKKVEFEIEMDDDDEDED